MRVGPSYRLPYRGPTNAASKIVLTAVVLVALVPLTYWWLNAEIEQVKFQTALSELKNMTVHQVDQGGHIDEIVYINSTSPVIPSIPITDDHFNLQFPLGVRVKRLTEYCQWEETRVPTTSTGDTHVPVYVLGWHSRPVHSFYYKQPFAHNNPQRDPLPSVEWIAESAKMGSFTLDKTLLLRAKPFVGIKQINESALLQFNSSIASREHRFRYIGRGYFYSSYKFDASEWLRVTGMLLEGSLFDYQLGDLFARCIPGDIRVSYAQVSLPTASLIAQHRKSGVLAPYKTANKYNLGLVREGLMSPEQLVADKLTDNAVDCLVWRIIGLVLGSLLVCIAPGGYKPLMAVYIVSAAMIICASFVRVLFSTSVDGPVLLIGAVSAVTLYIVNDLAPRRLRTHTINRARVQ